MSTTNPEIFGPIDGWKWSWNEQKDGINSTINNRTVDYSWFEDRTWPQFGREYWILSQCFAMQSTFGRSPENLCLRMTRSQEMNRQEITIPSVRRSLARRTASRIAVHASEMGLTLAMINDWEGGKSTVDDRPLIMVDFPWIKCVKSWPCLSLTSFSNSASSHTSANLPYLPIRMCK